MMVTAAVEELTQKELCKRLGIKARQVRNLHGHGIPRSPTTRLYPWPDARDWYIRFKQEEKLERSGGRANSYDAVRARKVVAQAELAEIERDRLLGQLVAIDDVEAMVREPLDRVDAKLLAVPGKWAASVLGLESIPEGMKRLQVIVDDIRAELRALADEQDIGGDRASA